MWLLHNEDLKLHEFQGDQATPKYAILSHTWGGEEVSFADLQKDPDLLKSNPVGHPKQKSISKIVAFCEKAYQSYDLIFSWVDTCCIDKSSSADLSEAINSMYRWYADSLVCIVFLADVVWDGEDDGKENFISSRWFTRGWTLQELIAPRRVVFFDKSWNKCGDKEELKDYIEPYTGIPWNAAERLQRRSVAERMSWAAFRKTTRSEDKAYSLLGLFDVNMPLLYGEGGRKAFHRLQVEIMRHTPDESIFAWEPLLCEESDNEERGMLAKDPYEFARSQYVVSKYYLWRRPFTMTHLGVQIELDLHPVDRYEAVIRPLIERYGIKSLRAAALRCTPLDSPTLYVLILKGDGHLSFTRVGYLVKSQKKQLGPMTEVHIRQPF